MEKMEYIECFSDVNCCFRIIRVLAWVNVQYCAEIQTYKALKIVCMILVSVCDMNYYYFVW